MADLTQDPASTATTDGASEGYRPLSLLALVGFLLALLFVASVLIGGLAGFAGRYPRWTVVAFAVAVVGGWLAALSLKRGVLGSIGMALAGVATLLGLGGLVASSGTSPWLLPWPVWLLVGAALLTCWLASSRIAASEGTLGGAALARWGVGLTLFFTLCYGAYRIGNTIAVRAQGQECTDEFLELVKSSGKDPAKLYEAFAQTMAPRARPAAADLRRFVEVDANSSQGVSGGAYTTFINNTTIRLIRMFGDGAKYEKIGTAEEHEKGGYRVRVTYRATGDLGFADFDLFAFGQESTVEARRGESQSTGGAVGELVSSNNGAVVRREWHIEVVAVPLPEMRNDFPSTEDGKAMMAATASTNGLVSQWLDLLAAHRVEEAYLATLPPEKRAGQIAAQVFRQHALLSLTGPALGGALRASPADLTAFQQGLQAFKSGIILDVTGLYPPAGSAKDKDRQEIIARVQKFLAGEASGETRAAPARAELPLYHRTGDTITISFPVQIRSSEDGKSRLVEGELEIVGPWSTEPLPSSRYRISRFRLARGPETERPRGPR